MYGREAILPGNPPLVGTITGVREVEGVTLVEVFVSKDDRRWVPVKDIELVPLEPDVRVIERDDAPSSRFTSSSLFSSSWGTRPTARLFLVLHEGG